MALDHRVCAQQICARIGGRENLVYAAHCATRLRLTVSDPGKVDLQALRAIEGVRGVVADQGDLQLVLGTGTVDRVYHAFVALTAKSPAAGRPPARGPLRMIQALGSVFGPILPAMIASGLMVGLVRTLGGLLPAFAASDWYGFLELVASTAFDYLPVLAAVSAAQIFGGNLYLGGVLGLCMVHADLISAWAVRGAESGIPAWHLLIFQVPQVGYQGHVIPVVIAVWCMSRLEGWLHRHVPEMIDLFVTPLLSVSVTALLTFTVLGPVFSVAEHLLLYGAQILLTKAWGLGSLLLGAGYSATVVCGVHHFCDIVEAGLVAEGVPDVLMPVATAANLAQCGACLAVAVRTREKSVRAAAAPAAVSAALGITEPAIFGVNLRLMRPFGCAMVGGGAGALFGALTGLGATAYGVTALPGILIMGQGQGVRYSVLMLLSAGVAFCLTLLTWKEPENAPAGEEAGPAAEKAAAFAPQQPETPAAARPVPEKAEKAAFHPEDAPPEQSVIRCEAGAALQPVHGEVVPLEAVPDETFAAGYLGKGVGIRPAGQTVYAPFAGTVASMAATGHAVGLRGENGMDVLIHVGLNTVDLNGVGFTPLVKQGETVRAGQPLVRFEQKTIREAGLNDIVVVTLVNSDSYRAVETGLPGEEKNRESRPAVL